MERDGSGVLITITVTCTAAALAHTVSPLATSTKWAVLLEESAVAAMHQTLLSTSVMEINNVKAMQAIPR
ncbi:hypothetical protein KIN20_035073 [Parelaphostrongylus tenuis]|uniref:Secreted protein n=1 Tax=Parelaphostrongylus tenuis TaxID=148309 RepID=A0AAD5RAY2_PARTN|nr:hypothetical protein KIN20_035073 [Parelaphostrongylus tenuis]